VIESTHLRFDGWTLARASGELTRDGRTQRLPPQPLALLIELLDHAGEVVTREAIVKLLWPRGIVEYDNSLNAVVRKLRVVLADDSETPRYIETLPRIGYRFVGKIEDAPVAVAAPVPAAAPPAVLPPRRFWASPAYAVIAMAVIAAGVGLWVNWRAPTIAPPPAPPKVTNDPTKPQRTTNERAYELYLQGKFNRSRRDTQAIGLAIENFQAALKEDPYFADAWAALAEAYSGAAMTQVSPTASTYEEARGAALRAIELDDKLGHGHTALAHIHLMYDRDLARAEAELKLGLALDSEYSRNWHTLALLRAFQGRLPEAMDAMRRAREIEPTALLYSSNYGLLLFQARRYDEAIAQAKALLGSQPRLDQARSLLIRALVAKGETQDALEQLPLRISEKPNLADAGFVYAHTNQREDALREVARLERVAKNGFGTSYDIAIIQAALGDVKKGCAALERTLTDHSLTVMWMRTDPRMDPLRKAPCYAVVEKQLYRDGD
jgi:DNA-binding winged helix-turn-helix (wHTH) protein/tetratricopeptide (TPR) repeat protein